MDKFMEQHRAYTLRTRMNEIHELYSQAIFRGDLVLELQSRYKSLSVMGYRLKGTFWVSTAVYFDFSLIAIIAENGTIYDYVNAYDYPPEILTAIQNDLNGFINTIDKQSWPHIIYPVQ